jgi:hypothetical protein
MSVLIKLASDFIEKMTNPSYGGVVNDDYALKFSVLLNENEFEGRFVEEIQSIDNINSLTSSGWVWILNWLQSKKIELKSEVKVELIKRWLNIILRSLVIESSPYAKGKESSVVNSSIYDFDPWLRDVLTWSLQVETELKEGNKDEVDVSIRNAESLLFALMQAGTPLSLAAAGALLNHEWYGQGALNNSFEDFCKRLDRETGILWRETLRPRQKFGNS